MNHLALGVVAWVALFVFYWALLYAHGERERALEVAS